MSEYASLNIFEKMSRITEECPVIEKTLEVERGLRGYRAVSETAILDAVRPLEAKYGVYSYPCGRKRTTTSEVREFYDRDADTTRKAFYLVDAIETTYRFVNVDKPDEHIDMISYATGLDTGDKGPGKAMTYSDKYALIKAYKIRTNDALDPDTEASPVDGVSFSSDTYAGDVRMPAMITPQEAPAGDCSAQVAGQKGEIAESAPVGATQPPQQEAMPAEASAEARMTVVDAKAVVIPNGDHKGKTMGEVLAIDPKTVYWYATDERYGKGIGNKRHPEIRMAAQLLQGEAENRMKRSA